MNDTAMLPGDWNRNPGMAMRTARRACFEHESMTAFIDVDEDAWAVAKLYTSHDTLEGVQFREQKEIENQEDMAIVVQSLADTFYDEFAGDLELHSGSRD